MMILKKSIEARMIQSQIDIDNNWLSLIVEIWFCFWQVALLLLRILSDLQYAFYK